MKCSYSNHTFSKISLPWYIKYSEKEFKKSGLTIQSVICPKCKRNLHYRKHPNSGNEYLIIPAHNTKEK